MDKNKFISLVASCLTVLLLNLPAYDQKLWDKKPYQQWSDLEVLRTLVDSPWAKPFATMASRISIDTVTFEVSKLVRNGEIVF